MLSLHLVCKVSFDRAKRVTGFSSKAEAQTHPLLLLGSLGGSSWAAHVPGYPSNIDGAEALLKVSVLYPKDAITVRPLPATCMCNLQAAKTCQ